MDTDKLIAQQALKIAELEEYMEYYEHMTAEIHGIIFCVGGPLNDNRLGYTPSQMVPFDQIAKLTAR